jgi:hypothetical protein
VFYYSYFTYFLFISMRIYLGQPYPGHLRGYGHSSMQHGPSLFYLTMHLYVTCKQTVIVKCDFPSLTIPCVLYVTANDVPLLLFWSPRKYPWSKSFMFYL